MDISPLVNWTQLVIWVFASLVYVYRVLSGRKKVPKLAFLSSNNLIGVVIALGLIAMGISFFLNYRSRPWEYKKIEHFTQVSHRTFRNEKVLLDGHRYENCKFYYVTFVYNGTSDVEFVSNEVYGPPIIATENPSVVGTMSLLKGLGYVKDDIPLTTGPDFRPNPNVNPPTERPLPTPSPTPSNLYDG